MSDQPQAVPAFTSSADITQLVASLAKAQGEFPRIPKNKTVLVSTRTGGKYSFAYAPLETIMDAVRPVLSKNQLAVVQLVDDKMLSTLLLHTSGQWLLSKPLPIRIAEEAQNSSQALGSAITYAKRYSICAMLGVVADDDDDGNTAEGNTATVTKDGTPDGQRAAVTTALTGRSVGESLAQASFLKLLRIASAQGTTELKKVWNGATKDERMSIDPAVWETIKADAGEVDKKAKP